MALICRKSMQDCPTPGMCSPHDGCSPTVFKFPVMETPKEFTAAQVREQLWALVRNNRHPNAPWTYRTQAELAKAIGVSLPFLNDILHDKREPAGKVLEFLGLERVVTYHRTEKTVGDVRE